MTCGFWGFQLVLFLLEIIKVGVKIHPVNDFADFFQTRIDGGATTSIKDDLLTIVADIDLTSVFGATRNVLQALRRTEKPPDRRDARLIRHMSDFHEFVKKPPLPFIGKTWA